MNEELELLNFDGDIFDDFSKIDVDFSNSQETFEKSKIPVIMISGFLGAGKTTFLNNILRENQHLKIGVIVNDFGQINIDNRLVSGAFNENQIDLSNGCICCMVGDNGLREPLDILANKSSNLDVILVEASGVAEPYDLMNVLRHSGNEFTFFGGNIYLIDAKNFDLAQEEFPTHFKKCLQTSDILVINKTSKVSKEKLSKIRNLARSLNARAPIFETTDTQIDWRILFENFKNHADSSSKDDKELFETHNHACNNSCHHEHLHHQFSSISFSSKQSLDPQKFIDFLDNLPQNMFRMKGFCYFGMKGYEQKYTLQIVGKTIDIRATDWQETPQTELVLIGAKMDKTKIKKVLESLIDQAPEDISPENMMNFERFFMN